MKNKTFSVFVADRDTKDVVASYTFHTKEWAMSARIDIMTEWVRMCGRKVVVSSVVTVK